MSKELEEQYLKEKEIIDRFFNGLSFSEVFNRWVEVNSHEKGDALTDAFESLPTQHQDALQASVNQAIEILKIPFPENFVAADYESKAGEQN